MPKLTILVGPPGSGKSTYAKTMSDTAYINQDSQGKDGHMKEFAEAVAEGLDIVVDRMNFNKEQRSRYLKYVEGMMYKYETEIIVLHEPYQTCYNRCINRVGHETIKNGQDANKAISFFFKNYERPSQNEADKVIFEYPQIFDKPDVIICDLDGTLCNIDHRLKWIKDGKKNWPMFFNGIPEDGCNEWCAHILNSNKLPVVLCSGRGEEYRSMTKLWLDGHLIMYNHLFMRGLGDHRQDSIVKEILLDFEILTRYKPLFAIDDRQQVVDMWRRRGIVTLQCAKGDF